MKIKEKTYTFWGSDGTDKISFKPAYRCNSAYLPLFGHWEKVNIAPYATNRVKKKPYHKTVSAVFLTFRFQKEDKERPHIKDLTQNIQQSW